ncbi:glycoside hydrolase family 127 protein [Sporolactobacillus shoreicorticis]|uniref:Beta-L-arabinofuranosidase domain-containing protein n=1 Tax=Sporolactobacillus shoreicorticis TaxID=1923877 RepID=A0ABW5S313_9BACL|nr:beta-L-arabinofuranosidase domain-containing protein [Sporolactobacillus shoreicorticis]MCO7127850.1 glycoside hydrolase family 127 protein [Sporolactobacillus shoreicorticis]
MKPIPFCNAKYLPNSTLKEKFERNINWMLSLTPDQLLYNYRKNAGLDTKGAIPLTVWESPDFFFRGHFTGHYLSGASKSYVELTNSAPDNSKAIELKNRVDIIVEGLKECQEKFDTFEKFSGYLAAEPSKRFDNVENLRFNGNHYVPYYAIQKLMDGLMDAYEYLGNTIALQLVENLTGYVEKRMERLTPEQINAMIDTRWYQGIGHYIFHQEFGAMHRTLLRLYKMTKKQDIFNFAKKFDREWFRNMLIDNDDKLGYYSCHSNTELVCAEGMLEHYHVTGDEKYKQGVVNFMNWMHSGHELPTKGISGRSAYPAPADYGSELFDYPEMFFKHLSKLNGESCCSHDLNYLSSQLFADTKNVTLMDDYEIRFINAIMAQQNNDSAIAEYLYNLSVSPNSVKHFERGGFWCCVGSGTERHATLVDGIYYKDDKNIYVAQYFDSILDLKDDGITITQDSHYPENHFAHITVESQKNKAFTVYVRVPKWSANTEILVEGQPVYVTPVNGFVALTHEWGKKNEIRINFNFELRYQVLADRFNRIAIYYGPILLAAQTKDLSASNKSAKDYLKDLEKIEGKNQFRLKETDIIFKSLPEIPGEIPYNVFVKVSEEPIVKAIDTQNDGAELDHQWTLAVEPEKKNYLKITYDVVDDDSYSFQIENDDKVLFTQTITKEEWPEDSYYIYPLPLDVTQNRTKINIKIKPLDYEGLNFDSANVNKIEVLVAQ